MDLQTRLPARIPTNHRDSTAPGPCVSSGPAWLEAPFRAELLRFSTRSRTTDIVREHHPILVLRLEGRAPLVLPVKDLLSPRRVKEAVLGCWDQLPALPDRETWRRTCNRWLHAATDARLPYGEGRHRVSQRRLVAGVIAVLRETEGGGTA
jgi:hypothetical protein